MSEIKLALAGEVFSLKFKNIRSFFPFIRQHRAFLTEEKPDFFLNFYSRAANSHLFSVSLRQKGNQKIIGIKNPEQLQQSFRTRHLEVAVEQPIGLENYLRVFFSQYLFRRGGGFLLHASTIGHQHKAYIFTGSSGVGKSTIARISKGKLILTDDLVAIRRLNNGYHAFAMPFGVQSRGLGNLHLPLAAIYLISHAKKTTCYKIPSVQAALKVISNIVLIGAQVSPLLIDSLLGNCYDLLKRVPCYGLPFNKNEDIWRHIKIA